jgi:hypothetical protein
MLNNIDPLVTCPHSRRVGGKGDGPKWVCDPHRLASLSNTGSTGYHHAPSRCLIYSIGSKGNYRFEDGIVDIIKETLNTTKNDVCEIHVFDPNSIYARPNDVENNNIHYHSWGIVSSYDLSMNIEFGNFDFKSFQETQSLLGHTNRTINIFKIDCEGCEFGTYKDWVPNGNIHQILVEIHPAMIPQRRWKNATVGQFFDYIVNQHNYIPFSKEANTHPGAKPANTLFELGFIKLNKSFLQEQ